MSGFERLDIPAKRLAEICTEFGVRELAAFGSVLRDDFGVQSDVDLLVEFVEGRRVSLFDLLRLQHRLEDLIGRSVDLVPKSGLKPALREQVLRDAVTVYAA